MKPEVQDCGIYDNLSALGGLDGAEIAEHLNREVIAKVDKDGDSDDN